MQQMYKFLQILPDADVNTSMLVAMSEHVTCPQNKLFRRTFSVKGHCNNLLLKEFAAGFFMLSISAQEILQLRCIIAKEKEKYSPSTCSHERRSWEPRCPVLGSTQVFMAPPNGSQPNHSVSPAHPNSLSSRPLATTFADAVLKKSTIAEGAFGALKEEPKGKPAYT